MKRHFLILVLVASLTLVGAIAPIAGAQETTTSSPTATPTGEQTTIQLSPSTFFARNVTVVSPVFTFTVRCGIVALEAPPLRVSSSERAPASVKVKRVGVFETIVSENVPLA